MFPEILSGWAAKVCENLQRIYLHEKMAMFDSVVFNQLVVNFGAGLEKSRQSF